MARQPIQSFFGLMRTMVLRSALVPALAARIAGTLWAQSPRSGQQPTRDTPAQQQDAPPPPKGEITGRVVAADTGRPVKRARAYVAAPELPEGRAALTDDNGVFDI